MGKLRKQRKKKTLQMGSLVSKKEIEVATVIEENDNTWNYEIGKHYVVHDNDDFSIHLYFEEGGEGKPCLLRTDKKTGVKHKLSDDVMEQAILDNQIPQIRFIKN